MVEPNGVLNDGHWKAVAVGLDVRHGWSAYPELVKATQPQVLFLPTGLSCRAAHALRHSSGTKLYHVGHDLEAVARHPRGHPHLGPLIIQVLYDSPHVETG